LTLVVERRVLHAVLAQMAAFQYMPRLSLVGLRAHDAHSRLTVCLWQIHAAWILSQAQGWSVSPSPPQTSKVVA
jgi:hypothetical protein